MLRQLSLGLFLALLGAAGFKLALYSEHLTEPNNMLVWFIGGFFTFIGTFGALGIAFSAFNETRDDTCD